MKIYISMLRGINVSGQKKIIMEGLKKLYESLGFKKVQTYIQSGNVIFQSTEADSSSVIQKIEKKITKVYGFEVSVLIRTPKELCQVIARIPFTKQEAEKSYVTFLSDVPVEVPTDEINKAKNSSEKFKIIGKEIYFYCPTGYGKTKLSNNFFEKKLKLSATTRNWNTVNKLLEIAESR